MQSKALTEHVKATGRELKSRPRKGRLADMNGVLIVEVGDSVICWPDEAGDWQVGVVAEVDVKNRQFVINIQPIADGLGELKPIEQKRVDQFAVLLRHPKGF